MLECLSLSLYHAHTNACVLLEFSYWTYMVIVTDTIVDDGSGVLNQSAASIT